MRHKEFKISNTERNCLVIERLAGSGIRACAIGIIILSIPLLGAAGVRQFSHKQFK
jgi:hypothetical protein